MAIPSKNRKIHEKDDLQVAQAMQRYKREISLGKYAKHPKWPIKHFHNHVAKMYFKGDFFWVLGWVVICVKE